jgi:hypothetical protein
MLAVKVAGAVVAVCLFAPQRASGVPVAGVLTTLPAVAGIAASIQEGERDFVARSPAPLLQRPPTFSGRV